jgi:hypothetical protein
LPDYDFGDDSGHQILQQQGFIDQGATKKLTYAGIMSTGFKDFLLKPELQRAVIDCGFEHPSEGTAFSY